MVFIDNQRLWTKDYIFTCISCFFLFMTFYSCMAVLPSFVMSELKSSQQQAGLTMTMFLLGSVLFRPFSGRWLDQLGRKKMVLISLTLYLISSIIYLIIKNLTGLLILRFIHGIAFALANTTLFALAADLVPEKRRGEGIGYFATFINLAMVIGPFLGLTIAGDGNYKLFFIVGLISAALSFFCGNLIHVPKIENNEKPLVKEPFNIKNFFEPNIVPISFAAALMSFAYASVSTFSSVYAKQIGLGKVASYFFVCYAVALIISRPFVGKLFDRSGANTVIYPSFFIFFVGLITLAFANGPFVFLLGGAIIGVGNGTLYSAMQTKAVSLCPAHRRGVATSTYFLFFDGGMGIGAYILGIIIAHTSYRTTYLVSSAFVILSVASYYFISKGSSNKKNNSIENVA